MKSTTTIRKISFRFAAVLGFFTTLFSMNFICQNSCISTCPTLSVFRRVTEVIRIPAMMRMNAMVYNPTYESALDNVDEEILDLSIDDHNFGLATRVDDFSKGADGRDVQAVREMARDYSMIVPASLSPVADIAGVGMQIVDHSISAFFNQAAIKNTFVGRAAETVEKKLKAEVDLGGSEPESAKHNIKFQVRASETKASMEYRGLTNCDLSYSVAAQKANLEIFEPLSRNSNIVFTHSDAPSDRRDMLSLRMHW